MVRIFGFLIGLGFVLAAAWAFAKGAYLRINSPPEVTAEQRFHEEPRNISYSFDGPFGRWDVRQLQRGFQVYHDVCVGCHSLNFVAFRNLREIGYNEAEVRAIADRWPVQVPSINPDTGEPATRKAIPADHFPNPYANETAARVANNNSLPPDLSLMAKAREGGPAYIYSILTGFRSPPAGYQVPANLHYNPYFANLNIAMPPPLTADGQVTYAPGNPAPTRDQMARDVSAFLMWAAEPNLVARKNAGIVTIIFLIFATILAYMAYQQTWHRPRRREPDIGG